MLVEVGVTVSDLVAIKKKTSENKFQNQYILLLRDKRTNTAIPMWIAEWLYYQILIGFKKEEAPPVPQMYDLYIDSLLFLGATPEKAVIDRLERRYFRSHTHIRAKDGTLVKMEAAAADAVAVAVRMRMPIFVEEELFVKVLESEGARESLEVVDRISKQCSEKPG